MSKERVVYGSYGHTGEANWLLGMCGFEKAKALEDASLLLIGGGEDINPKIYTEKVSKWSGRPTPRRDETEINDFNEAVNSGKKIIGICRGAQMACALSGGKLIQHVNGHSSTHDIDYIDGDTEEISSVHHQMLYPFDMPKDQYVVIASSSTNRSSVYVLNDEQIYNRELPFEGFREPEIVWFPKTNALAIQGHPEFMYGRYSRFGGDTESKGVLKVKQIFELFFTDQLQSYVQKYQKQEYVKVAKTS